MTINDLLDTMTGESLMTIHDSQGAGLVYKASAEDIPEFILEYTVKSVDVREHHTLSVVTNEESILQPIALIHANVNELYDLGDCHSYASAVCTTVERLHDLAETAEKLAQNLEAGRPWRAELFPTCSKLRH